FTVVAGNVTLWRPFIHLDGLTELQNDFSSLHLLAPSRLGTLKMNGGTISFNSDGEIAQFEPTEISTVETATLTRVLGDAHIRGNLLVNGPGVLEMKGTTVVSNGIQQVGTRITSATLRNLGTWQESGGSTSIGVGAV